MSASKSAAVLVDKVKFHGLCRTFRKNISHGNFPENCVLNPKIEASSNQHPQVTRLMPPRLMFYTNELASSIPHRDDKVDIDSQIQANFL